MESPPKVIPESFAGRYVIDREIGEGATAVVYLARDSVTGDPVAIKIFRPELTATIGAERVLREIRVTQALQHPHIARVLDSGSFEGRLYLVLPYLDGGTLRTRLDRERQLPIAEAVRITRTIADALDYAHGQGLIHRDVKPENILFVNGQACLADFGIARAMERAIDESTTSTGLIRGTPAYMSPEQASGNRNYDGRTDLYSLACVLYEMVSGMPAFVGPTPEAIIAQRFTHAPRDIRVYRPSAPVALVEVVAKCLERVPADRYATAREMSDALASAELTTSSISLETAPVRQRHTRPLLLLAGAAVAIASVAGVKKMRDAAHAAALARADTTVIAVLPFEGDTTLPLAAAHDMLYAALGQWRGLSRAGAANDPAVSNGGRRFGSEDDARDEAIRLGAGRYVRMIATGTASHLRLLASLHDTKSGQRLYEATVSASIGTAGADSAFRAVGDSLLLRGIDSSFVGSRMLPAVQAFAAGMRLIDNWDLRAADSTLAAAVELDPRFGRASLWLAHARFARNLRASAWQPAAERALTSSGLSSRETSIASALIALGQGRFADGCRLFESLRQGNARDYIAWYGSAKCLQLDDVVIPDRRSRSGWRFRSSYHQAAYAFAEAFRLQPTLHHGLQPGAYRDLRLLLFTNETIVRTGHALAPDSATFRAYPEWSGDSLVFYPYPTAVFGSGNAGFPREAIRLAVQHQRSLFVDIARKWASALPGDAGTKEALAISLEMVGEKSAIDTLRAARALAKDDLYRLQLAAEEVFLRLELTGLRDSSAMYLVRSLADSILQAHRTDITPDEANVLAPIAALLGRCGAAATLQARRASGLASAGSNFVRAVTDSVSVLMAAGCTASFDSGLVARAVATVAATTTTARGKAPSPDDIEYQLFGRILSFAFPRDSARIARFAEREQDYLLRAERAALQHDWAGARAILERQWERRGKGLLSGTPDALYPEARVWLMIGDSAQARTWLDPLLARSAWLTSLPHDAVSVASLVRCLALRAELAVATGDRATAREWATMVSMLWADADEPLKSLASHLAAAARF